MKRTIFAALLLLFSTDTFAQTISTFAGGGSPNGLPALSAPIGGLAGLIADGKGNFYFSAQADNRVVKIDGSGRMTVVAGSGERGSSGDGGPATQARLFGPTGLALDNQNNLYIADTLNFLIRKVDLTSVSSRQLPVGEAARKMAIRQPRLFSRLPPLRSTGIPFTKARPPYSEKSP